MSFPYELQQRIKTEKSSVLKSDRPWTFHGHLPRGKLKRVYSLKFFHFWQCQFEKNMENFPKF